MTFMVNKQHQFTLLHDSFSMEIQEILTELAAIYHTSQLLGANGIQVKRENRQTLSIITN